MVSSNWQSGLLFNKAVERCGGLFRHFCCDVCGPGFTARAHAPPQRPDERDLLASVAGTGRSRAKCWLRGQAWLLAMPFSRLIHCFRTALGYCWWPRMRLVFSGAASLTGLPLPDRMGLEFHGHQAGAGRWSAAGH